jgi:ATP-binding cassette subfamily F protein 3
MQSFVDRFRYKASKAKQAQSRMKAIEKLTMTVGLQRENPFSFHFFSLRKII